MQVHLPAMNTKRYIARKVSLEKNNKMKRIVGEAFVNPDEFFNFYPESQKIIIGSKPQGPRYDKNDSLIPHSYVGNAKHAIITSGTGIKTNRTILSELSRISNRDLKNDKKAISDIVTDIQITTLFNECKDKININKTTFNDFMNNIPIIMTDKVKRPLMIQQRILNDDFAKTEYRGKFEKRLVNQLKREEDKLLLLRTDGFRTKKEQMEYIERTEQLEYRYGRNSWIMSLRRPNNFKGSRKGYINFGTDNNPFWGIVKEELPLLTETVINPTRNSKASFEVEDYFLKTSPNFSCQMKQRKELVNLRIEGKNLLQVEEDNIKMLRGKKKLYKIKYPDDHVHDLIISKNWK